MSRQESSNLTISTYDRRASDFSSFFQNVGPQLEDIQCGLDAAHLNGRRPRVLEIGCGDGRESKELFERADWYEGIDPSTELLSIARQRVPGASFVEATAQSYSYHEKELDAIFAFASLLHVPKEELSGVFEQGADTLRTGGIYHATFKATAEYTEALQQDNFGERMFYFYNRPLVEQLAGVAFRTAYAHTATNEASGVTWLKLGLEKL